MIDFELDHLTESNTDTPEHNSGTSVPQTLENLESKVQGADVTKITIPKGSEITASAYNKAIDNLQKTFKESMNLLNESMNIMNELRNVRSVKADVSDPEFMENAEYDAVYESAINGAIFEAVDRSDKEAIKDILKKIKNDFKKYIVNDHDGEFKDANMTFRIVMSLLTGFYDQTAKMIWNSRLWQIVGIIYAEEGNIGKILDDFNEKHSEELGNYKLLHSKLPATFMDLVNLKFGWKNDKDVYLVVVDKKLPSEIKKMLSETEKVVKEKEKKDKKDDK